MKVEFRNATARQVRRMFRDPPPGLVFLENLSRHPTHRDALRGLTVVVDLDPEPNAVSARYSKADHTATLHAFGETEHADWIRKLAHELRHIRINNHRPEFWGGLIDMLQDGEAIHEVSAKALQQLHNRAAAKHTGPPHTYDEKGNPGRKVKAHIARAITNASRVPGWLAA